MPAGAALVQQTHEKVAICTLDPGTTSGMARGVLPRYPASVWEGLAQSQWESWEVEGEPARQAWEIMGEYADWIGWPECKRLGVRQHIFVIEDFVLRLGRGASSKRNLLDPVRVTAACETLCIKRDGLKWCFPVYQQPSSAKNFATDERLRKHGLWVKSSTHRRDAVRHLCVRYATLVGT